MSIAEAELRNADVNWIQPKRHTESPPMDDAHSHSHTLLARSDVIDVDPSLAPLFFSENVVSTYFGVAFLTVIVYSASERPDPFNYMTSD